MRRDIWSQEFQLSGFWELGTPETQLQAWKRFWNQDWWVSSFNYPRTVLMALGVSYCYSDTWEHGIFPLKCQLSLSTSANPSAGGCRVVERCSLMVWSKPIRSRAFYLVVHDCQECCPTPACPFSQGNTHIHTHSTKQKDQHLYFQVASEKEVFRSWESVRKSRSGKEPPNEIFFIWIIESMSSNRKHISLGKSVDLSHLTTRTEHQLAKYLHFPTRLPCCRSVTTKRFAKAGMWGLS